MGFEKADRVKKEYERIFRETADELGISEEEARNAYKFFWKFFRRMVTSLPLKKELTEEEFSKLRTSCNIPRIGKLYCDYERYKKVKRRDRKIKEIMKRKGEHKDDDEYKED